jgi:hypothetical protein
MVFNPSELAWQRDLEGFNRALHGIDLANPAQRAPILKRAKQLQFYKYFEEIGAAQVVMLTGGYTQRRSTAARAMHGSGPAGQRGPFRMPLGQGNTHWGFRGADSRQLFSDSPSGHGPIRIGQWSQRKGIIRKTTQGLLEHGEAPNFGKLLRDHTRDEALEIFSGALAKGKVAAEVDMAMAFTASLQQKFDQNRRVKLLGWNVWFDVMDMQTFAIRHNQQLLEHGLDPFLLANKYQSGDLIVNPMEEYFFDVLRSKGLRDDKFAKTFLRHGRFAPELFGEGGSLIPGTPIDLRKDLARRKAGQQSLLRGKPGWKLELIENVFLRYLHLTPDELGLPKNLGRFMKAHDAMYDTSVSYAMGRRFQVASRMMKAYSKGFKYNPTFMPESFKRGSFTPEQIEVLSMSRAGFLGQEAESGLGKMGHAAWLIGDDAKYQTAVKRNRALWTAYGRSTKRAIDNAIRFGVLTAQNMSESGTPFAVQRFDPELRHPNMFTGIRTRWQGTKFHQPWGPWKKGAMILGGAAFIGSILWNASKDQDTSGPAANLPPNYMPGQQGQKVLSVPWKSPYAGPGQDHETVNWMMLGAMGLGLFGAHMLPNVLSERMQQNLYLAARAFEDATPFRVGRIFGMSGKISSYLTPEDLTVGIDRLLGPTNRLSHLGKIYAGGLDIAEQDFASFLAQQQTKKHASIRFKRTRGPWTKVSLGQYGTREVRMFESTSRIGQSFTLYGSSPGDITPRMRPSVVSQRVHKLLFAQSDPRMLGGTVKRGLQAAGRALYKRSSIFQRYMHRFAAIPKWEANPVKLMQRMGLEQDFWIPGYTKTGRGFARMATGYTFDAYRSVWHLLRGSTAVFGWDIGQATSLKHLFKKSMKVGAAVAGIGLTAGFINDQTGGALFAPFRNLYERFRLTKARISDALGFTEIRKQHPDVYGWAAGAYFGTPAVTLGVMSFLRRAGVAVPRDIRATRERFDTGTSLQWDKGRFQAIRERPFTRSRLRMSVQLRRLFGRKRTGVPGGIGASRIGRVTPGWLKGIIGGYVGLGALLFTPFVVGEKYSHQEWTEIFSGERRVPIKRGRWWEFGSTPYEGARTSYYRMHRIARAKARANEEVPGAGPARPVKFMFDPYWRERESYYDRPYPITSTPFEEVPFVGPILARTVGRFLKPPKLMHTDQWRAGNYYAPYGQDVEPDMALGGLPPPMPRDPLGWRSQIREVGYKSTEYMGLRGFLLQQIVGENVFGGEAPFVKGAVLQPSRFHSFTHSFYESELGGMAGMNELFRRFFPRPEQGLEVNPLRNRMPNWMPGEDYFINYQEGDPYGKIPFGEERMPGAGFAALHPELEGVAPRDYPSWARFQILADVAPWSKQFRIHRALAYREFGKDPQMLARFDEIDQQVEQVKQRRDFKHREFTAKTEEIAGTVEHVGPGGTFRLAEYPHHTFRAGGLNFGLASASTIIREHNRTTKEKAAEQAYNQRYQAQNRMIELMVGNHVNLRTGVGALNRPDVAAQIYVGGTNVNRLLAEEGLARPEGGPAAAGPMARMFGGLLETVGHLPQKIPGPFFLSTKLWNQADPMEDYRRSQLYGTSARFWDKPFTNFIQPYYYNTVAKITPGEYVPGHVQRRRETDRLFDRLEFYKAMNRGDVRKAGRTAVGVNIYGAERNVISAMPYRERPYMEEFIGETDPGRRRTILGMVSADMQRALVGQWTRQYAAATGQRTPGVDTQTRMRASMAMAQREVEAPPQGWAGYNQGVDIEDIKAVYLKQEGMDQHDFNIWEDRMMTMHRKPYLNGSHEFLNARPMDIPSNILSRGIDRRRQQLTHFSEGLSHSLIARFNYQNRIDRRDEEFQQYLRFREELGS